MKSTIQPWTEMLAGFAMAGALAVAWTPAGAQDATSFDGLQKVAIKGVDVAYARPGATLAGYTQVQLAPVQVSFHKDWKPTKPGTRSGLSTQETENIRAGLAKIVTDEFAKTLQGKGGYPVVAAPGPAVLLVKADVVDLYVTSPGVPSSGRSRTYAVSAGSMTLVAALYDSETGELIARVADRAEARDTGNLRLSSSVVNVGEAREIASKWARILRRELDEARGIGKR